MVLIAVYNPASGDRRAKSVLLQHALPLLTSHSIPINGVFATEYPGHAGQIVGDLITKSGERHVQVILCSGDGTLHEIINGIPLNGEIDALDFVLIPCGTANALYSSLFPPNSAQPNDPAYILQSLHSYLRMSHRRPLQVAVNTISSSAPTIKVLSTIVTSTCLHTSILRDSEALREEFPGVDRFKIAAQNNSGHWYYGGAKLFPVDSANPVQIFDPGLGHFVNHPEAEKETPFVELKGPFIYFLSTVNVDRLEPTYVIAPVVEPTSPGIGSCHLIVIRPSRDPAFRADDRAGRDAFAVKLWQILTAPYMNGAHVHLRYDEDGKVTTDGEGPLIIEYLSCGGWEWYPEQTDDNAHFLCSDGAIYQIPQGGRLATFVEPARNSTRFGVYA